ncbi:MAG TPA: zinc dependent phospholipase C family protein [Clostridia bacterium]|nr:zinc dependent phospholipase C family protein [Clostridia bacterium]
MPAVYAHQIFGFEILKNLPTELAELITEHKTQFQIGLQGPDYLFFYKPFTKNTINQTGYDLHYRPAAEFLEKVIPVIKTKGIRSPEYAYLLGFICHFMLDSTCHPYVEEQVKTLSFDHIEMESEFERLLLTKAGHEPLSYPVHKLIPTDNVTAECIASLYEGVSVEDVTYALKSMYFYKKILTAPGTVKRNLLLGLLHVAGKYESMQGQVLKPVMNPKAEITNPHLWQLFHQAVKDTVPILADFHVRVTEGKELNERFNRNFD